MTSPRVSTTSWFSSVAALAADVGGELHVVHAYMVPIELMVPDASQIHAVVKETRRTHKEAFDAFFRIVCDAGWIYSPDRESG